MPRDTPTVLSWRATMRERAMVEALARAEQTTISVVLRRLLVPAVRARLAEIAGEDAEG